MDSDRLLKLKVVAMVAVMLEESTGDYLQTSPQRDPGSEWSVDHRRVATTDLIIVGEPFVGLINYNPTPLAKEGFLPEVIPFRV